MMLTHAAITGAAGEIVGSPWIAFPLGMLIHLVMDKIPHVWPATKGGQTVLKYVDSISTALFVFSLLLVPTIHTSGLIAGALGGVVIDIWCVGVMREKGRIAVWHTHRQPHKQTYFWYLTDTVVFTAGLYLIWIFR
jgi:hypothetical protein